MSSWLSLAIFSRAFMFLYLVCLLFTLETTAGASKASSPAMPEAIPVVGSNVGSTYFFVNRFEETLSPVSAPACNTACIKDLLKGSIDLPTRARGRVAALMIELKPDF